jgi:uncharacterized protein YbdZ (MbtH family)
VSVSINPFDDENDNYSATVNREGQLSLWPTSADAPDCRQASHK